MKPILHTYYVTDAKSYDCSKQLETGRLVQPKNRNKKEAQFQQAPTTFVGQEERSREIIHDGFAPCYENEAS